MKKALFLSSLLVFAALVVLLVRNPFDEQHSIAASDGTPQGDSNLTRKAAVGQPGHLGPASSDFGEEGRR